MTDSPAGEGSTPRPRPVATVRLGPLTVTGPLAVVFALVLLGGFLALVIYARPSLGMWLSGGLWAAFLVFWSATAGRGAPARAAESEGSRAVHQTLMNFGLLLLFIPFPGQRWRYLPARPWVVPAGLAVQVLGALLHVWARRHLGRNWSSAVGIQADHQLVRSGPYRWVRHPIYTAILLMAVGTAVVSAELHGLIGLASIAVAYVRKIRLEERLLGQTFGAEYAAYRQTSWALVPGLF